MAHRVLIITGDTVDATALASVLGTARNALFDVERVSLLAEGVGRLKAGGVDAIIADLSLPDSQGIETFDTLFAVAQHTPILILSAADDEPLTTTSVQHGAQGYLTRSNLESTLVPLSLHTLIQRKAVEESFFLEKARAEITLNSISDAVIGTDMAGNIDYLNIAAENMTGWSREEARGRSIVEVMRIIDGTTREPKPNPVELVLERNIPMALTAGTILIHRDGREVVIEDSVAPIHNWDGSLTGAVIVFHDCTAAREMALKMAHLAQHDFLTNLPNRVLLHDRVEQAICQAKRSGHRLAVLFLDLDNFKHINDSLGHVTGDTLLQAVADRLRACVRASDTVSRQGGDEFVILVTEDRFAENAATIANKILTALTAAHTLDEHELFVTTSIGISVYPADGQDAETLIKNADTAMYSAKEKGRNNFQFFKSDMNVRVVERLAIESSLRHALDRQEFLLFYQPAVHLETGALTGAEALLRWNHPQWGLVTPERFLPIAESCGLMLSIGRWVLREACTQAKRWQDEGLAPGPVSVNISAPEFCAPGFVEDLRTIVAETGMQPKGLQLELTESVLMRDIEATLVILDQLKQMGMQLAVDNFGTGFSSLSQLARFPLDVLKIDSSLIRDIRSAKGNGIAASAIIAMAVGLRQRVVAEGVEEQAQRAFLTEQHCDAAQGYLFCRPLAADAFTLLLTEGLAALVAPEGDGPGGTQKVPPKNTAVTGKAHPTQRLNTEATQ